jgi:phosphoribosylanthranilate isomerase
MNKIIKVCGIKDPLNARMVSSVYPDMMGFILYRQSPRAVSMSDARAIVLDLDPSVARVGVFVNEIEENILMFASELDLDYIQLHGEETNRFCSRLLSKGLKVIKAAAIGPGFDMNSLSQYKNYCNYLLLDSKGPGKGGTGRRFNWEILDEYDLDVPFILSGGIGPDTVTDLALITNPAFAGIDLNSRFESYPGMKDVEVLSDFVNRFRNFQLNPS